MLTTDPDEAARTPQVQTCQVGSTVIRQCASAGSAVNEAANIPVPNDDGVWFGISDSASSMQAPPNPHPAAPNSHPASSSQSEAPHQTLSQTPTNPVRPTEGTSSAALHTASHTAAQHATHNATYTSAEGLQHSQPHGNPVVNSMTHSND